MRRADQREAWRHHACYAKYMRESVDKKQEREPNSLYFRVLPHTLKSSKKLSFYEISH